jgi:penicillin amidase
MSLRKILKYVLVLLVLVILTAWVILQSHQPQLRGKSKMAGLKSDVEVFYDDYGIPHIYANSAEDAYMAFGYVHAQDRLFQMELMRRAGLGRLSEIFGAEFTEADIFFRTLGTNRQAEKDSARFEKMPANMQKIVNAYLHGVNDYIKNGKLPLEYTLIGIDPEPFTIKDMYAVAGYTAYTFAYALRTDPLVEDIYLNLGEDYLRDFDLAIPSDSGLFTPVIDTAEIDMDNSTLTHINAPKVLDNLPVPLLQGSNNWAVGPSRTLSGKVIIANDTHIKYNSPSAWYEAHIEYPGFGFYGNYLAGIPVALIGHSRNHGWGLTMFEDDDSDFFIEEFLDADSTTTRYRDSLQQDVVRHREIIKRPDAGDTAITVYETYHGTLINQFLPEGFEKPVSLYWNYTQLDNQLLEAFFTMNYASNIQEFKGGVMDIQSPGLNVAYGDASGNIAMWASSKLIRRPEGKYGKRFLNGADGTGEYEGFYSFDYNPSLQNPREAYLATANQYHDSIEGVSYPGYYAPDTRFKRIKSRLTLMTAATVDSMQSINTDVVSIAEAEVSRSIAEVLRNSGQNFDPLQTEALKLLENWDGNHRLRDQEPTIYYRVLSNILERTFLDELSEEKYDQLLKTHLIKRSYPVMLNNPLSPWWDDVSTPRKKENRTSIFVDSFIQSVSDLQDEFGTDPQEWRWENIHFVVHPHPLGKVDLLRPWFDVGLFPAPGGNETVNNAGFTFASKGAYTASYGPAMRIVIDFADVENAVSVLPTGNSGNVMSPHYKDQAEMYVKGETRKMMMNEKEIKELPNRLLLQPGK